MRKSLNIFAAVTVTALAFSLAGQPAEAAIFTWRTGASGTGSGATWANPTNWVGGTAPLASGTTTNDIVFTSNTTSGAIGTQPGNNFGVNQVQVDGTTSYTTTNSLSFADGGSLVNTSPVTQTFNRLVSNGAGFNISSTSGTLKVVDLLGIGTTTFSGAGQKVYDGGNTGPDLVNAGGPLTVSLGRVQSTAVAFTLSAGSLTIGSGTQSAGLFAVDNSFTGASGATLYAFPTAGSIVVADEINYGGMALNLDLNKFPDTVSMDIGDIVSFPFNAATSYSGNIGSLVTSATSGPFVGLAWSQVGQNWLSSTYNTNQQLEFRPADGNIYLVPEPTQMVFVAGVAAAFGAWRMRKLRRNARGSDATAC
jgi:hypothetical protein